ncbi:hypothetical protein J14TS2_08520 [Bacillus sp. J14TS2]|uniref:hypothetical protein n=1 Tax=Bacillus sp. J14TS2 TaxID=2807188 RepID=UPI001B0395CE|nr:hypothetical protein [Bacillus sp. J14TS2]GIN70377.1 hypothetical protein J14TS2_08520 [Bacillus sp. J14TS2]
MKNKEVLEEWMDKYTLRLVRLAYAYVKDWLKAEDQVQEMLGTRIIWWKRAYNSPFSNFLISVEKSTP